MEDQKLINGGLTMKRIGKPVFFIVALLIVALTITSFTGIKVGSGSSQATIIKAPGTFDGVSISGAASM